MDHRKTPSTAFESYDSAGYFGVCNFSVAAIVSEILNKVCANLWVSSQLAQLFKRREVTFRACEGKGQNKINAKILFSEAQMYPLSHVKF